MFYSIKAFFHVLLLEELYRCTDNQQGEIIKSEISELEQELKLHDIRITNSSIFRSRCRWVKNREHSTKMFFQLEKKNYMNKNMKAVVLDSGEVSYDQNIILEEQTRFFETLYTTHKQSKFKLDKKSYNPELTPEMRMHCEKESSVHEIYDAVMTMKANKVGGPDALTAEFYRTFYYSLKDHLLGMYQWAFQEKILLATTRRGLISLLPKKNKDNRLVKNMRPLTLALVCVLRRLTLFKIT